MLPTSAAVPVQATLDDLGTPLVDATFVVVDLETTGGSSRDCAITEIGAVKVRGGEVLAELGTLVNPGTPIPVFIAMLTGITDAMVASAPRDNVAVPAFLDFARGCVLVAHNAPFDVGFLQAACRRMGRPWPAFDVIDTARLARSVVTRDESPNCKLSSLARLFRSPVVPDHRALTDARATVDVLHGLIARLGPLGVTSVEELAAYSSRVSPALRRKRHLAAGLPHGPGVYVFRDGRGRPLYVGKSRDVRTRVSTYFTASEQRTRMAEMVAIAESIDVVPCPTELEAAVRELRMIGQLKPHYNRRSKFPERTVWVKLTVEPFPRLSTVREVRDDGATYLGPFGSRGAAEQAMAALHEVVPLRQCTGRLSPRRMSPACALFGMGRCGAPCDGSQSVADYAAHAAVAAAALGGHLAPVVDPLAVRVQTLAAAARYEDAATHRDRLATLVRTAARAQRLRAFAGCAEVLAARRHPDGGWDLACVRWGRLAGTARAVRGVDPRLVAEALRASAEHVVPSAPAAAPCRASTAEEVECLLRWVEEPGTRLVALEGEWSSPVTGAGAHVRWAAAAAHARDAAALALASRS